MSIGDNIRFLRKKNNMTQKELAVKINISTSSIGMYEQNRREPDNDTIRKFAELFNVSTDYLLGNSDNPQPQDSTFFFFYFDESLKEIFILRLKKSMEVAHIEAQDILFETEIKKEHLDKYISGQAEPTLEDLCSLADILGVTTDYLLGRDPEPTAKMQNMANAFVNLDDDNQDIIIGETKKLLKEQRSLNPSVAAEQEEELSEAK